MSESIDEEKLGKAPDAQQSAKAPSNQGLVFRRVLVHISYDGTNYSGFAFQTNASTISNVVQDALRDIDPEVTMLTGASRTDAGVHATAQPISFATTKNLHSRGWVLALAQRLPADISVVRAAFVPLNFDPRRDPVHKRYRYTVFQSQVEDPFVSRIAWRIGQPLDLEKMSAEARVLLGEHDFEAYRNKGDRRPETIRRIDRMDLSISRADARCLDIEVQGNRFMYNMVRIIAGTLVDIGRGRLESGAFERAFRSGNRRDLGMTAPAQGLRLLHVALQTPALDAWPAHGAGASDSDESVESDASDGVEKTTHL